MSNSQSFSRRRFLQTSLAAGAFVSTHAWSAEKPARTYKIIAFSKPFQSLSFDDTAHVVAEVGWDGIECPVRKKGQIEPERAPDELPKLSAALKKRGKDITILTTDINSVDQPNTETVLRTAAKLGIKRYRLGFFKYDEKKSIPDQLKEVGAQLKDLAALNKELGLTAGFQNHSGKAYIGAPVWDVWSIIKDLDPRHMGMCFDIGHATLEGGYSWPIEARLTQPYYTAVYVKDFLWQKTDKGWKAQWVMLGEGMVDKAYFNWLKTTPYDGPISQHHEYDHGQGKEMMAKMQKDLQVLRSWLA